MEIVDCLRTSIGNTKLRECMLTHKDEMIAPVEDDHGDDDQILVQVWAFLYKDFGLRCEYTLFILRNTFGISGCIIWIYTPTRPSFCIQLYCVGLKGATWSLLHVGKWENSSITAEKCQVPSWNDQTWPRTFITHNQIASKAIWVNIPEINSHHLEEKLSVPRGGEQIIWSLYHVVYASCCFVPGLPVVPSTAAWLPCLWIDHGSGHLNKFRPGLCQRSQSFVLLPLCSHLSIV
jgi:hypothetical protein